MDEHQNNKKTPDDDTSSEDGELPMQNASESDEEVQLKSLHEITKNTFRRRIEYFEDEFDVLEQAKSYEVG